MTVSVILERIHHCLFDPYSFQMRFVEAALHDFEDSYTQILRCGHVCREFVHQVQVLVVVPVENILLHKGVEIHQIADHSGLIVYLAAQPDLNRVVVTVAKRVIALAIDGAILVGRQLVAVQSMRRGKHVASSQVSLHASP
jgi:hypothetical protein